MFFKRNKKKKTTVVAMNSQNADETKTKVSEKIKPDTNRRVFNLIIVDESGSMSSIYQQALSGMNETLQTIRCTQAENPDVPQLATLLTFNSARYNEIYRLKSANETTDINESQYRPNGCTPLFDAMGRGITDMQNITTEDDLVLVTIITDGMENSSREYDAAAIKALVEQVRAKGWIVTYIGANQDVDKMADSLAIKHRMSWESTNSGAGEMFAKDRLARKRTTMAYCCGFAPAKELDDANYFQGFSDEEIKEEMNKSKNKQDKDADLPF